jgi:serine phosphatase RsbU (regulator of sigma subunit)
LEGSRFAGYGIVEFGQETKDALREIAEILEPKQEDILHSWIDMQWRTWQPPGLSYTELKQTFGSLLRNLLMRLRRSELEECLEDLEISGRQLAEQNFPFQALIISIHYFEESYISYLLQAQSGRTQEWLIGMDEFLHSALAAMATSYFEAHRKDLLDQAEVGRIVQEGLLANIPKRTEDLEIAHVYVSARERARLGGDFLDFFRVDSRGVAFIIGDLSGHGLEAAADSVMLRSLFRGFMREEPDIARAMERTNRVLMTELRQDQFATALAAVYDMSGMLSLVSAGHPYPIICSDRCGLLDVSGDALAIRQESSYNTATFPMPPGATFVAYTDGLIEAGGGRNQFGEERAMKAVAEMRDISARAVAEHLIDESLRHSGGKFADDVAVLVLKRREGKRRES